MFEIWFNRRVWFKSINQIMQSLMKSFNYQVCKYQSNLSCWTTKKSHSRRAQHYMALMVISFLQSQS